MSKSNLPKQIDPKRLCDSGTTLQGIVPFKDMKRLGELVLNQNDGQALILLDFEKDLHGFRRICGKIHTQLLLRCQRCLSPVSHELDLSVKLGLVPDEEAAKRLAQDYEPLIALEGLMSLTEIIEDEILLGMPIVSKHDAEACPVKMFSGTAEEK